MRKNLIIAHRGIHDNITTPENSISSFRKAIDKNLPIEFDIQLTKDNKLVIFHDDNLKRMTGVDKFIQEMNFDVNQFAVVNRKNENDLAHVMERVFGWLVTSQGYSITDPYSTFNESFRFFFHSTTSYFLSFKLRHRWFSKFVRFFSRIEDKSDNVYLVLFKCLKIRLPKQNNK